MEDVVCHFFMDFLLAYRNNNRVYSRHRSKIVHQTPQEDFRGESVVNCQAFCWKLCCTAVF